MSTSAEYEVKNKVVLITGANRGIGKALVEVFLAEGVGKVYAAVRTMETAQPLVAADDRVSPILMDMSKPETIGKAAAETSDVDIFINNAGILSNTDPLSPDAVSSLEQEMRVNVYGLMHAAQQFAPALEANRGIFVQLNSVASLRCVVPSVSTYSASKAAAFSMTQALRITLAQRGIRVVSVHPGPIATDMISNGALSNLEAAPPRECAQHILSGIQRGGDFLIFPDPKSKKLGEAYAGFATYVFEQGNMY